MERGSDSGREKRDRDRQRWGRCLKWLPHLEKGTQTDSTEKEGCKMVAERPLMGLAEVEADRVSPAEGDSLSKETHSEGDRG